MDVNELIDNLRMPTWHDLEDPYATLLDDAADALSTLQAENAEMREKIEDARLEGYIKGLGEMSEENERLLDELEQVREDNKKLCSAMMTIRRSENSERMCAEYRVDYCTALSHQETADLARIVFEDLMREDARMRGPQTED